MTLPIPAIDHVIVNARDALDDAASLWTRLGFQLTPRGHHTLGSSNNLAILGTDYIELLGVTQGAQRTDVLDWPAGLNGLVFKTLDSDGVHASLAAAGVPVLPPQAFSRPVDMGDGRFGDAAFRTVRLDRAAVPAGRMFFCHHLTPELVWHDPWRRHPNGAVGLGGMLIAAHDPALLGASFTRLFGPEFIRKTEDGIALVAGLATVEVITPEAAVARLGAAVPDLGGRSQAMVALLLRTANLSQAAAALQAGDLGTGPSSGRIVVPAARIGGLALVFQE